MPSDGESRGKGDEFSGTADEERSVLRPRSPSEALEPARAPEPPRDRRRRRMHPALALVNGLLSLVLAAFLVLGGLFYFAKVQFDRPGPLVHSTVVVIPKGDGVNTISGRLEREGIIADRRIFVASVIYFKAQDKLKAGEYEFRRGASMRNVLDTLVEGRSILHRVTVPEGLTSQQVVALLNNEAMLDGDIAEVPPEGSLLPDTYAFSRGTKRQELIERMQAYQRRFLSQLWEQRADDLPIETPEEALVLASIVEKETGRADERPRVASVFLNRLKRNMRLQSDPTIVYGLVGGEGTLGRPIRRSEINRPTPYNTYQIDGLPPGPIANPGRAAIEAVLRPARTDDLFFVADGDGGHAFATNLREHNRNVARWRVVEREMRAKAEEEARRRAAEEPRAGAQSDTAGLDAGDNGESAGEAGDTGPAPSLRGLTISGIPGLSIGVRRGEAGITRAAPQASPFTGSMPLPERNPKLR